MIRILSLLIVASVAWAQTVAFPGPGMPASGITLLAHVCTGGSINGVTSSAIDTSGANLIVVAASYDVGAHVVAADVSDSKSNSYTVVTATLYESSGSSSRLFYLFAPTVGSGHTFTVTKTASFATVCAYAFSGAVSSPLDQNNGTKANSGTTLSASITPTVNNEVIVSHFADGAAGATGSVDSGMTLTDSVVSTAGGHYGGFLAYKIQTTAAAITPQWTSTSNTNMAMTVASFK